MYEIGSSVMANAGTVAQIFFGAEDVNGSFAPTSLSVMRLTAGGSCYYQVTGINNSPNASYSSGSTACGAAWKGTYGYGFSVLVEASGKLYVKSNDTRFTYTATAIVYGP